jgi:hypothetical protein
MPAVRNYEEAVRVGQLARTILPDINVLPHTALCPVQATVYMKAEDLERLLALIQITQQAPLMLRDCADCPTPSPTPEAVAA